MNIRLNKEKEIKQEELIKEDKPKRKRKKQPPKGSRWTIVVAFFLSLGIIAIFYLQKEFPLFWEKVTSPLVISNLSKEEKFDASSVLSEIKDLTKDLRGSYGVYVYRMDDRKEYGLNQDKIFPAASLMKLPVMITLYQKVETGKVDLETKYILKEKDKRTGAGILQNRTVGSSYSYRELAELMGHYSDNTAFFVLRNILTDQEIQKTVFDLGMKETSLRDFETTPKDMGFLFRELFKGNILNNRNRDEILSFLTDTVFEDWIPQGVPEGTKVSHKIGQDLGTFSDGGIIFASRPFVLIIMSSNSRQKEVNNILPEITKRVWVFENPQ